MARAKNVDWRLRLSWAMMVLTAICSFPAISHTQDTQTTSLCRLQETVAPGTHIHVRVSGIYSAGPENSALDDPTCSFAPYKSTWVDFELKQKRNDKKLRELLKHSKDIHLESEGEFYGPPVPDKNLPEGLQKVPRWGHLGCCRTKLVIHVIWNVKSAPNRP